MEPNTGPLNARDYPYPGQPLPQMARTGSTRRNAVNNRRQRPPIIYCPRKAPPDRDLGLLSINFA